MEGALRAHETQLILQMSLFRDRFKSLCVVLLTQGWGQGFGGRGHMYAYGRFVLMYGKNHHNVVE